MVHGYHVIVCAYGFWLPNDPRGSWSDFVGKWELVRFGKATKGLDQIALTLVKESRLPRVTWDRVWDASEEDLGMDTIITHPTGS